MIDFGVSGLEAKYSLPPAVTLSDLAAGSALVAKFEKRQTIGQELAGVFAMLSLENDQLEDSTQLLNKVFETFENRIHAIAIHLPEVAQSIEVLQTLKPELLKAGQQILDSDKFRDLVKIAVLGFLPSHADAVAKNPFYQILKVSLSADSDMLDFAPLRNFLVGLSRDLSEIELRYRRLSSYANYAPERLVDYLFDLDQPVTKASVFNGLREIFQSESSFAKHFQLIESTERLKVREVIEKLCERLEKLANDAVLEQPSILSGPLSRLGNPNEIIGLIVEQFSILASELSELGFSYRKDNLLKLKKNIFSEPVN